MVLRKIKIWYLRYERLISSLSLLGGFIFDAVTLKRVDLFLENFWVIIHLAVAACGIILLNLFDPQSPVIKKGSEEFRSKVHFWLILIVQFAFGGLLSTFLVFYFRSATLSTSWPFLLLLALVFISNEAFKKHYSRLAFQINVLFISIFSFLIFFVPVVVGEISDRIFILSGLLSLGVLIIFLVLLRIITREKFIRSRKVLRISIIGMYILINILYFANIIPPLPLSLKDAGIYQTLIRNADGSYTTTEEPQSWFDYFNLYPTIYELPHQTTFVYSAIFAPTKIDTTIIHEWQYYDEQTKTWKTTSMIDLPINGGRDGGYRTYSSKTDLFQGKWRVNVLTTTGQYLGRIRFQIISATNTPASEQVTL